MTYFCFRWQNVKVGETFRTQHTMGFPVLCSCVHGPVYDVLKCNEPYFCRELKLISAVMEYVALSWSLNLSWRLLLL